MILFLKSKKAYCNISFPEVITLRIDHLCGCVPPKPISTKYVSHNSVPFLDCLEAIDDFLAIEVKVETSVDGKTSSSVRVLVEAFVNLVAVFGLERQSFDETLIHTNGPYNVSPFMFHLPSLYWQAVLIHSWFNLILYVQCPTTASKLKES